ncbi:hypothetical protein BS50DRAFT_12467 [Corynespora cassiicola Philippines]|uniref:Uncharacterized protein n=1 Tax=Corynespora cassiicola Philippines TaxID=1448308 RepID=A0A2T2P9E5_CORCC|nr:hypothetical protein BS50DRAFT_12467 [Corynespora cassiicola Philippines]
MPLPVVPVIPSRSLALVRPPTMSLNLRPPRGPLGFHPASVRCCACRSARPF